MNTVGSHAGYKVRAALQYCRMLVSLGSFKYSMTKKV